MLKRVSIQNFKSLKDVTLDLQKVNLLIGPEQLRQNEPLEGVGICYEAHEFKETSKKVWVDDEGDELEFTGKVYSIKENYDRSEIGFGKSKNSEINFQLSFDGSLTEINWSTDLNRVITRESSGKFSNNEATVEDLKVNLGKIIIYKPDPNKIDKPGPIGTGEESVSADASNLVSFLDLMGIKYRRTVFNQIETDLQKCVPEFVEIKLEDVKRTEELTKLYDEDKSNNSFRRLGLADSKQGVTYWSDELSEGTLYFLALLCIINQPNPPKLLLLEEPEKGIHPRRIEEVVNFIFGLADDKDVQIIMTTHSPAVVDMFKDMPESVFIFDKDDDGATHVKNLQTDIIEPETEESERLNIDPPQYLNGLGQAWKVGFLGGVPR